MKTLKTLDRALACLSSVTCVPIFATMHSITTTAEVIHAANGSKHAKYVAKVGKSAVTLLSKGLGFSIRHGYFGACFNMEARISAAHYTAEFFADLTQMSAEEREALIEHVVVNSTTSPRDALKSAFTGHNGWSQEVRSC